MECFIREDASEHYSSIGKQVEGFVAPLNECSLSLIHNMEERLLGLPFYKQLFKKRYQDAKREMYKVVDSAHIRMMTNLKTDFFENGKKKDVKEVMKETKMRGWFHYALMDAYCERLKKDIEKMRKAVQTNLEENGFGQYSELYSHMECVRVVLALTCGMYDSIIENARIRCGVNFRDSFITYRPSQSLRLWTIISDEVLCKGEGESFDFNKQVDIMNAYRKLEKKITSDEYITECSYETLVEFEDQLSDEYKEHLNVLRENRKKQGLTY